MQIRIAALADYTNLTDNGKLNIMGIFSTIYATAVPAVHQQMQFVLQLAFEPNETGERTIRIVLQDADGRQILSVEGSLNIPHPENPERVIINQVVGLHNVLFPRYGSYEFVIEVDGEAVPAQIPLDIVPTPQNSRNQV